MYLKNHIHPTVLQIRRRSYCSTESESWVWMLTWNGTSIALLGRYFWYAALLCSFKWYALTQPIKTMFSEPRQLFNQTNGHLTCEEKWQRDREIKRVKEKEEREKAWRNNCEHKSVVQGWKQAKVKTIGMLRRWGELQRRGLKGRRGVGTCGVGQFIQQAAWLGAQRGSDDGRHDRERCRAGVCGRTSRTEPFAFKNICIILFAHGEAIYFGLQ